MLILSNHISVGQSAAVEFALEGIFGHASGDLLGQFRRVILCHTFQNRFQNDAFSAFGDSFCCRYDTDIVFLQCGFVSCRVEAIAGKTDLSDIKNEERSVEKVLEAGSFFALIGSQAILGKGDIHSKLLSTTKNRKRYRVTCPHR